MLSYHNLIENEDLKTGDLLLFSYNGNCANCCNCLFTFFTGCIKCCTKSKYSHSAMVIKDPSWDTDLKGYYVLQSSYESFPDAENHELKLGVELVSLEELFDSYNGKIFWRKIDCIRNETFYKNLEKAHSVVHNRPYDINPYDWFRAAFKIDIGPTHRLDTFWCSALMAYVYVQLGLLPKETPWSMISPQMLSCKSKNPVFQNCLIFDEVRIL